MGVHESQNTQTPGVWGVPNASKRGTKFVVAHKWADGYVTRAVWGVADASERGTKSEVAHKWAWW
eukprot:CAMPEP_0174347566 /NCGR_PEP_ID=MMETSP0811_2-20130205/3656_1 /TAXON_ID=73025 ORGANISM="Eutreptiella gymnastica-like, Strain CCMP1594" /NCGR_SAMPLE_ID=MMETSP0811_2 /ASSEMBLY_ACC=CAM_ASM_000667 /LENGTH=64 /DNA_ID=CAMNT_0015473217 /DNA_START=19 /DNA_END=211 /DNA_ORIENTATION=-